MSVTKHATIKVIYNSVGFFFSLKTCVQSVFLFLDKGSLFVKSGTNFDNDRVLVLVAGQQK